ncbi:hypothetical protein BCR39DRAFT_554999 [Naematelia encephala]|uniref:TAFII28-like protein domain-containing protein n=1 Tax=Naematelia encephala TaxID=71784 RepID=A0A1Y2ADT0_9TREE|nr:hypothetical protein BCR39DRAFT_554999 [Naematelia encephala]
MSHLALPPASSVASGPSQPKKRRKPRPSSTTHPTRDLSRALDADDDVSEDELVAAPQKRLRPEVEVEVEVEVDEESGDEEEVDEEPKGGKGKKEGNGSREKVWRARRGDQLLLREQLDPDQARRYDAFSTVVLPTQAITKLNRELLDQRLNSHLAKIVGSLGKVFLTELIEIAKDIQPSTANPTGPLRPYHLRLAKARLDERGVTRSVGGKPAPSISGGGGTGVALRPKKGLFRR